ncbi:hypothetical protein PYCC9005_005451 [Savitreella phatthalungensis]
MQLTGILALASTLSCVAAQAAYDHPLARRQAPVSNSTVSAVTSSTTSFGLGAIPASSSTRRSSSIASTRRTTTTTTTQRGTTVTVTRPVVQTVIQVYVVSYVTRTTTVGGGAGVAGTPQVVVSPVLATTTRTSSVTVPATFVCPAPTATVTVTAPASTPRTTTATTPTTARTTSSTTTARTSTPATPAGTTYKNCLPPARAAAATSFPNLIVPVQRANPSRSYGTQYFVDVRPGQDVIVQFDIASGSTKQVALALPPASQLVTSSYTVTGDGKFAIARLPKGITAGTTFANAGANLDTLTYTNFTAATNNQNLQVILPNQQIASGSTAFVIRSVSGATLRVFEDFNCAVAGVVLV